jgi:hypothetical protein
LRAKFEQVRQLKLNAYQDGMPPEMAGVATALLKTLRDRADQGEQWLRVWDITKHLPQEATILVDDTIDVLDKMGDIVIREISGDRCICLTSKIAKAEKGRKS